MNHIEEIRRFAGRYHGRRFQHNVVVVDGKSDEASAHFACPFKTQIGTRNE